jgi:hypothetical protein
MSKFNKPTKVQVKNSTANSFIEDAIGNKTDDQTLLVALDKSLISYCKGILTTVLAINNAQTEVSVYAPQVVDVNNVGHIEVCIVDKDVGLVPAASMVAGTFQLVRVRGAVSTNIGAVTAWTKANGRISTNVTFAAADWATDDAYQIVPQGDTTYTVGVTVYYPAIPTISGYIGDLSTIEGKIDSLLADVGDASASTLGSVYGILGNPPAGAPISGSIGDPLHTAAAGGSIGDNASLALLLRYVTDQVGTFVGGNLPTLTGRLGDPVQTITAMLGNDAAGVDSLSAQIGADGLDSIATQIGASGADPISTQIGANGLDSIAVQIGANGLDPIATQIGASGLDPIATQIGADGLDSIAVQIGCDGVNPVNTQLGYGAGGSVWQDLTDIKAELEVGSVVSGAAGAGSSDSLIVCPALTQDTGYFNSWCVLVTSGVRAGQIREVASWDLPTTTITLYNPLTGAIGVADTFVIMSPNFMANVNIGVNNTDNRADTSLVVANADGSLLERDQFNQEAIAAAAGDLTDLMADVGDASASTLGSILAITGNPGTKSLSDQIGADSTDSIAAQIGCDGVQALNLQLGYGAAGSVAATLGSPLLNAAPSTLALMLGDPGTSDFATRVAAIQSNIGVISNTTLADTLAATLGDFDDTDLVTRLTTIDGYFDVPGEDIADDVTMRDVIGKKTDTILGSSLMSYAKNTVLGIATGNNEAETASLDAGDGSIADNQRLGMVARFMADAIGAPLKSAAASSLAAIIGDPGVSDLVTLISAIAPLASISDDSSGVFSYLDAGGKQTVVTITTTTRIIIQGIWLDMTTLTQSGNVTLEYKIDGSNYAEVDVIPYAQGVDSVGMYIPLNMGITNDFKVSYTESIDEGAARNIPFSVIYSIVE